MGDTGPCGPCSEIHIDRGPEFGPDGGPLGDPHGDRFMEFWNLVFMQYNQAPDGTRSPLPKPSVDTGAGLERVLALLQGVDSVWETDLLQPLVETAQSVTGKTAVVGDYADRDSFAMRVLAEHARSSTMLVSDGVFPSNEGRGYVLRRILRRAVRYAFLLGTEQLVMPRLAETAIDVMGSAYPDVVKNRDFIVGVLAREEERFRHTLKTGLGILDDELESGESLSGSTAFLLHDTYGFPLELTQEIAGERDVDVDLAGFETEMSQQRQRAKAGRKDTAVDDDQIDQYREVVEQFGVTEFLGYTDTETQSRVLAVIPSGRNGDAGDGGDDSDDADDSDDEGAGQLVDIFLDRTPFYAESGGQVGDTGTIITATGTAEVLDTTFALPNLRRHTARIVDGAVSAGQEATAAIDVERREAIKRNHTGTHLLHWALRRVLGDHVKQAGSYVGPDRLRFDFSHYEAVSADEIGQIERLVNTETLRNERARAFETSKTEAEALGAIAFFGDKYGDIVRVLEAGPSVELCGGTHVSATGDIGTLKVVSESSIGSNLRRIEAITGQASVALLQNDETKLGQIGQLVGTTGDVVEGVQRKLDEIKTLQSEVKQMRAQLATGRASELAATAVDGVVVARVDGLDPGELRELTIAVRQQVVRRVALLGATPSGGVSLAAAVDPDEGIAAADLIKDAARAVGGGGGGKGDVATAGGKDPDGLDEAIRIAAGAAGATAG
jgi:alanyl-tRNA synthetase